MYVLQLAVMISLNFIVYTSHASVIARNCPVENGFCVSAGKHDLEHATKLFPTQGNSESTQENCVEKCLQYKNATGCELIWGVWYSGCYVFTNPLIHHGNGVAGHRCVRCIEACYLW